MASRCRLSSPAAPPPQPDGRPGSPSASPAANNNTRRTCSPVRASAGRSLGAARNKLRARRPPRPAETKTGYEHVASRGTWEMPWQSIRSNRCRSPLAHPRARCRRKGGSSEVIQRQCVPSDEDGLAHLQAIARLAREAHMKSRTQAAHLRRQGLPDENSRFAHPHWLQKASYARRQGTSTSWACERLGRPRRRKRWPERYRIGRLRAIAGRKQPLLTKAP